MPRGKGTAADAGLRGAWQSSPVAAGREIEGIEGGVPARGAQVRERGSSHARALAGVACALVSLAPACDEPARRAHGPAAEERAAEAVPSDHPAGSAASPRTPDDACAAALAAGTPERVRSTLHAIGYDDVFRDTCLAERAERDADATLCEQLVLPSLTRQCIVRVAVTVARPEACPQGIDEARDPLCVALAARDRRLCAAASLVDRAVCEEALGREHRCNHLPDEVRGDCDARGRALAALVTGEVTTSPPLETSLVVHIAGEDASIGTGAIERGATIDWSGCSPRLHVGDPEALALPFGSGAIALTARVDGPTPTSITIGPIVAGDVGATLELAPARGRRARASQGQVRVRTLELTLGGIVEGTFEATLSGADAQADGTFHTFVRDLAPRPASCDLAAPATEATRGEGP